MIVVCASGLENLLSEMEWTNDQVITLIELFRERPVLWNQALLDFKNKNLKNYAWNEISQEIKVKTSEVQSKMRNLTTTFQRIFRKAKSGSGACSKSKWFAFDHLMFLKDKTTPTFSRDAGINDTKTQILMTMEHTSKLINIKHENPDFEIKHKEVSFESIEANDWKDDSIEENLRNYEVKVDSEEFGESEISQIREIMYVQVEEETSCPWNEPATNETDPLALFPVGQNSTKYEPMVESSSTSTVNDAVRKSNSTDFKEHLVKHAREKFHKCQRLGSHNNLLRRLKVYTCIKAYTCKECNFETSRDYAMATHLRIHSARNSFKCAECGRAFSTKSHLKRHLQHDN